MTQVFGSPCNGYRGGVIAGPAFEDRWETCGAPLEIAVEVPGCAPAHVTFTWNDNTNTQRFGANWYVPVVLSCE